ncbi:MAG: hypothetical protein EXR47_05385 [Dehalococcoidia bacterium]|nr:hypothetical protein [Dehalococcoidia bacterium]
MKLKNIGLVAAIIVPVVLALGIFFSAWAASGTLNLPASADPYGLAARQTQPKAGQSTSRNANGLEKAALFVCPFH